MRKILLYFALKYNGDYKKIYEAIQNKEIADKEELENIETKINCKYITIKQNHLAFNKFLIKQNLLIINKFLIMVKSRQAVLTMQKCKKGKR